MQKRNRQSRLFVSTPGPHSTVLNWHNTPQKEFWFYARAFHRAAKSLVASVHLDANPFTDFDACPVVFMYRHALELHLKAIVLGNGGNFLANKPDPLSIYKTHSVSWLAQFVCQIVTALKWEKEFRCEGVENLADFKAVVEEINSVDPGSHAFRYPVNTEGQGSVPSHLTFSVREFAMKMDSLLELLDSTADALAAEWDMRSEAAGIDYAWRGDFEPPIQ